MKNNLILNKFSIAIGYFSISLFVGEWHPFTQVPMYNSFPNYAYAFYLADSTHRPLISLPGKYNSGFISHQYSSIAESKNIFHGQCAETKEQNQLIGKVILDAFLNDPQKELPEGEIELHRISFVFVNDHIVKNDLILYRAINE